MEAIRLLDEVLVQLVVSKAPLCPGILSGNRLSFDKLLLNVGFRLGCAETKPVERSIV